MIPVENYDKLNSNIENLTSLIQKQTSFKRGFLMSIVHGVGGVIGATVFAGVVLFVLSKFVVSIEKIPIFGSLVRTLVQSTSGFRPSSTPIPTLATQPSTTPTLTPEPIATPTFTSTPTVIILPTSTQTP